MALSEEHVENNFSVASVVISNWKRVMFVLLIILLTAICCGWLKEESAGRHGFETNVDLKEVFNSLDINNDGILTFAEFIDIVKHDLTVMPPGNELETLNYEEHKPVDIVLLPNDEIITLHARFKPLVLSSLTTVLNDKFLHKQENTVLKGIFDWKKPEMEFCSLASRHFAVFLPPKEIDLTPGSLWWIVPTPDLGGMQLSSARHRSPKLLPQYDYLYTLLRIFHKNPFLISRFAPQGTTAIIRGISEDLLDIVFRLHAEFQLNDPPNFPFWFTPSQFRGRIIMNKNGSSIVYFYMGVPSDKSLNVDMEWLNGPKQNDNMEVDIGYIPQLSLASTGPSAQMDFYANSTYIEDFPNYENMISSLNWLQEIEMEEAYNILEKAMYPFKEVPYYNFSEAYSLAQKQNKLIHAVLLWGALDDQSC